MPHLDKQFQAAVNYFNAGQLEKARSVANGLLEQSPDNPVLLQLLGEISWRQGRNQAGSDQAGLTAAAGADHR